MAVAGKVAITLSTENGGAWSADVTYDRLVAVKHNNNLYISRKEVANVEPPNDEFWFLALEGFGGEDVEALIERLNELSDLIQAIIDGTTQVGNAKTLDGHEAEYFLPKEGGIAKDFAVTKETNTELPSVIFKNSSGVTRQYLCYSAIEDEFWRYSAELKRKIMLDTGNMANHVLPLTGGRIKANNNEPLQIENTLNPYKAYLPFYGTNGKSGSIGFASQDEPAYVDSTGTKVHALLHTGNKPSGTYTGNGSTDTRYFSIQGVGKELVIYSDNGVVFVFNKISVWISSDGTVSIKKSGINYDGTTLGFYSNSPLLNASGVQYTYRVL